MLSKTITSHQQSDVTSHHLPTEFRLNIGKPQFSTIYSKFVIDLMAHMTASKPKHPDIDGKPNYYRKPKNIKQDVLDSAMRHLLNLYDGKLIDQESGTHNLICCAANLMIAYYHRDLLEDSNE